MMVRWHHGIVVAAVTAMAWCKDGKTMAAAKRETRPTLNLTPVACSSYTNVYRLHHRCMVTLPCRSAYANTPPSLPSPPSPPPPLPLTETYGRDVRHNFHGRRNKQISPSPPRPPSIPSLLLYGVGCIYRSTEATNTKNPPSPYLPRHLITSLGIIDK